MSVVVFPGGDDQVAADDPREAADNRRAGVEAAVDAAVRRALGKYVDHATLSVPETAELLGISPRLLTK